VLILTIGYGETKMKKEKITRQRYNELVEAEILRLKAEEKNIKGRSSYKNHINTDRAYRSIGTLGGG